ncbi:MAG: flippase-like domain-containing protein [Verrucomicrobia bacterium]|nr:flippase-like domain-containing protein [Verrucomicrobiota bacterium]
MENRNRGIRWGFWLKCGGTFLFLYALVRHVPLAELSSQIGELDPLYFVLSVILVPIMVCASCAKWVVIARHQSASVGFLRHLRHYAVGYYYSNLLPSNVGGDIVRAFLLGKDIESHSRAAITVIVERVTGVICLLLLGAVSWTLRLDKAASPYIWVPALGATGLLVFTLVLWFARRWAQRTMNALFAAIERLPFLPGRRWLERIFKAVSSFTGKILTASEQMSGRPVFVFRVTALTVLFYGLAIANVWLAYRTFGGLVPVRDVATLLPIVLLISMVPVSLGSLGLAEGAYVFYFSFLGVSPELSLAMGLLLRLKMITVGVVGLVVNWVSGRNGGDALPDLTETE